jgi:CheY-like chemotaxis protein/HPt (histidine-containing phosphotransfer) domain-containing protein
MISQAFDPPPPPARPSIAVLLVDDQPFVGIAVTRLLAAEKDIEVTVCHHAAEAVAKANETRPAVILQDLVMPGVDGLGLVRLFRANPQTSGTPIVVLSANDDAVTRERAMAEGTDDFLVKLPSGAALAACIRRHASRAAEATSASSAAARPGEPAGEVTLDREVIGWFKENGSEAFVSSLVERFLNEAESRVHAMTDAAVRRDHGALTTTAHALRGSSSIMGARKLAALCARVENASRGQPVEELSPAFMTEIGKELVRVREALAAHV